MRRPRRFQRGKDVSTVANEPGVKRRTSFRPWRTERVKNAQLAWDKYVTIGLRSGKLSSPPYTTSYSSSYTHRPGLYVFPEHDGKFGVSTHGKVQNSCGGKVQVVGPRGQVDVHVATQVVLSKLDT